MISCHDQQLLTKLRNLLTNAIKLTIEKGAISVSYEYLPDRYQVCVSVTSIGIPAESIGSFLILGILFYSRLQ